MCPRCGPPPALSVNSLNGSEKRHSWRGAWRRLPSIYTLEGPAIQPQILWSAIIYKKNIIFAFCLKRDSCHVFAYFIFHFGKVGFNVEALCWVQLFIISGWEL